LAGGQNGQGTEQYQGKTHREGIFLKNTPVRGFDQWVVSCISCAAGGRMIFSSLPAGYFS
jgi:hypothetical protein